MRRISMDDFPSLADRRGVQNLASAMRRKLAEKACEGKYGWNDPTVCSVGRLRQMLKSHLRKGDMVDVANFAMMIYNREHCMKREAND